jgi:hypothetical protein
MSALARATVAQIGALPTTQAILRPVMAEPIAVAATSVGLILLRRWPYVSCTL